MILVIALAPGFFWSLQDLFVGNRQLVRCETPKCEATWKTHVDDVMWSQRNTNIPAGLKQTSWAAWVVTNLSLLEDGALPAGQTNSSKFNTLMTMPRAKGIHNRWLNVTTQFYVLVLHIYVAVLKTRLCVGLVWETVPSSSFNHFPHLQRGPKFSLKVTCFIAVFIVEFRLSRPIRI